MQGNFPLVSIIIPYYNHAEFLKEAVKSALEQTYSQLEVIVIDDAGPAPRASAVLQCFPQDKVKVIEHQQNQGAAASRNTAVRNASGEFILPLDSDDLLEPTYLEKTLAVIDKPEIGGAYSAVKLFGDEDSLYNPPWSAANILAGKFGALICLLYRKQIFAELGGYDVNWRVGEDSDFFLRASQKGWQFKQVQEPLYLYRKHNKSTNSQSYDLKELALNLVRYHKDLYIQNLDEIIQFKEERYWNLFDEYKHLHAEFHKLLALYQNLEKQARVTKPTFFARLKSFLTGWQRL